MACYTKQMTDTNSNAEGTSLQIGLTARSPRIIFKLRHSKMHVTHNFFQFLLYRTSIIGNVHHTMIPCFLSSYNLDCPEIRIVKFQSHSKQHAFQLNYSSQLYILFHRRLRNWSSHILARSQLLMRILCAFKNERKAI